MSIAAVYSVAYAALHSKPYADNQSVHAAADMHVEVVPDQHDRRSQALVGPIEEGDVFVLAEAAAFASAAVVQSGAPHQPAPLSGLEADQAGDRDSAGALAGDLDDGGVRVGPRSCSPAAVVPVPPRPGNRSRRSAPPLTSYRRPLPAVPGRDRLGITFGRPAGRDLLAVAHAVQQIGHPAQGVADREAAFDNLSDPGQGPAGVFPAVRERTFVKHPREFFPLVSGEFAV